MTTNQERQPEFEANPSFAILAIGGQPEAKHWATSKSLQGWPVTRIETHDLNHHAIEAELISLSDKHSSVVIAGFGESTTDALAIARMFPEQVQGVVLFEPIRRQPVTVKLMQSIARLANVFRPRSPEANLEPFAPSNTRSERPYRQGNLALESITQPVMIFQERSGPGADIKVAAALQRDLGGPVEVQFAGPGAELDAMDLLHPALNRRIVDFASRITTGSEARRRKRQHAASSTPAKASQSKLRTQSTLLKQGQAPSLPKPHLAG